MHREPHPLINSLTEPLADNAEMKLAVAQILEQTFDPDHSCVPEILEQLDAQNKKKFPALGIIAIWCLAFLALGFSIYADRSMVQMISGYQRLLYFDLSTSPLPTGLTEQQRLLLGDPKHNEFTQKKLLFESDSNNPAYFAEYSYAYDAVNSSLPPDFLETAARIDPENSFFLYWAAGIIGKNAVEKRHSKKTSSTPRYSGGVRLPSPPTESKYTINDRSNYEEALALFKRATELPKFETYATTMMMARSGVIKVNDFSDFIRSVAAQSGSSASGVFSLIHLSRVIGARAEELSKNENKNDFLELVAHYDAILLVWTQSRDASLVEELVFFVFASSTSLNFEAGAERLALTDLAEKYRKQTALFNAERDRRRLPIDQAKEKWILQRSSILASLPMVQYQCASPPPLTDADLKPMRMVEHEVAGRIGLYTIVLSLLLAALFVFLFRFLVPKSIRLPARRIACLLKPADWIWISTLGIVLPILAFLYLNRFSPVSGRDYGVSYFLMLFPGLHLTTLLTTLILAPVIVTRWRLTGRTAAFKFRSKLDLIPLPIIGIMLVYSIVAFPLLVKYELNIYTQIALAAPLACWVGFVFFNALRIILGSARSRIIQSAAAMATIPAYPLAILFLCLAFPLYHQGEKYWAPQDKLFLINPAASDLGAYEFKVAAQKRKDIKAILAIE